VRGPPGVFPAAFEVPALNFTVHGFSLKHFEILKHTEKMWHSVPADR
jgi:hypothetical protein